MEFCRDGSKRKSQGAPSLFLAALLVSVVALQARAQTYQVIYNLTGTTGSNPPAGLAVDSSGNLYGTGSGGGVYGEGTVFELSPSGSAWDATVLHNFNWNPQQQTSDGANPHAAVVFGPNGSLFGTTGSGGDPQSGGTVFELSHSGGIWNESILHAFTFGSDGGNPFASVVFDPSGNLYGTTISGGTSNFGVVYELSATSGWQETVLWDFGATPGDGLNPVSNITFNLGGHIYGTTESGGLYRNGAVYELTKYGSIWEERTLYSFKGATDGEFPVGGLIADAANNLYGTTSLGGPNGGGTVFELTPSGTTWQFHLLYAFQGNGQQTGPFGGLVMDSTGALYGTTYADALGVGNVFRLAPSGGNWVYTDLHDFTDSPDGAYPVGSLVFDAHGNLYGTTGAGGSGTGCAATCGTVFEVTP